MQINFPKAISQITGAGREFLFPTVCQLCAAPLSGDAPVDFCTPCLNELRPANQNQCQVCSADVGPNLTTELGCIHCQQERFMFRKITSLGTYAGPLKEAVLRGKRSHNPTLLCHLSDLCSAQLRQTAQDASTNLIVPIPRHWTDRLFESQAPPMSIANRLNHLLKLRLETHILTKRSRTPKQHSLQPTARRKNLKSAFQVASGINLDGARILLVDDVLTTGTTCQRATFELRKAGAEDVQVFVLARGVGA